MMMTVSFEELENILAENQRLRKQVDALQERMSAMVYERQAASKTHDKPSPHYAGRVSKDPLAWHGDSK